MVQTVFVVAMIIVAIAAVAFGWWLDKGGQKKDADESKHNKDK